jgi:hypothetical protein
MLFKPFIYLFVDDQQEQQQKQADSSNYISSNYLLSHLQQLAPTPTTPPIGLPRLAPAPTDPQLRHQLQNHTMGRYLNALTMSNSKEKGNYSNKRSMNDDNHDQLGESTTAAEHDKRRRNTAASARFRQKKKLREQALEQTAKEMSSKCEALDKRVRELELEAKWLRALVVEKNPSLLVDRSDSSKTDTTITDESAATAKT